MKRIFNHLLFWFIFFAALFGISGTGRLDPEFLFIDLPVLLLYVYVSVYFIIPYFLKRKSYLLLIVALFFLIILLSYIRLLYSDFVYYSIFAPGQIQTDFDLSFSLLLLNAKDFSFVLFVFLSIKYGRNWLILERKKTEMENTHLDSEIRLMKSHIDHHFLFNTFNNIYALSVTDPQKTKNALRKLWGLLDFLVSETDSREIGIDKELRLIEDYIHLEKLRYGERLGFEFHIDENIRNYRIPPLIFFPFIENCFKHGSALDPGNPWIKINILELEDRIRFIARNSSNGKTDSKKDKAGIKSIDMVRKRLEYFFPDRYSLRISDKDDEYYIQLDIIT